MTNDCSGSCAVIGNCCRGREERIGFICHATAGLAIGHDQNGEGRPGNIKAQCCKSVQTDRWDLQCECQSTGCRNCNADPVEETWPGAHTNGCKIRPVGTAIPQEGRQGWEQRLGLSVSPLFAMLGDHHALLEKRDLDAVT